MTSLNIPAAALILIFMPGALNAIADVSVWNWVCHHQLVQAALAGINAAVVGILGAAHYTPVWTTAVVTSADVAIAAMGFFLLERWRVPAEVGVEETSSHHQSEGLLNRLFCAGWPGLATSSCVTEMLKYWEAGAPDWIRTSGLRLRRP